MKEEIFITKAFDNIQRHYRLDNEVDEFLYKTKDISKLRYIEEYDEFGFYLPNESFPRVIFKKEVKENIVLYIPRKDFPDKYKWLSFNHNIDYTKDEKAQIKKYCSSFKARPILPDEMKDYEKKRNFSNTLTSYVYEMREWCISIQKKELDDLRSLVYGKLQEIVLDKKYSYNKTDWSKIQISNGFTLYFYVKEFAGHTYYFLLDITSQSNTSYLDIYAKLRENIDSLVKSSCKGYPDWVLYMDFAEWKELEFDDKCNFALSEEEIDVLNYSQYPIFINGLAGSGKSTTLYYLFSHIYVNFVLNNSTKDEKPFLFLTYSEALSKKSYESIKSLIKSLLYHRGYSKTTLDKKKLLKKLNGCFFSFKEFLRTFFLTTEEEKMFDDKNHIDIVKFKDLYNKCRVPNHNKYSYIKIWSQIRNIKGKKEIDSNARYFEYYKWYNSIVKDNIEISKDSGLILWDDLSLIRFVVDNKIDNLSKKSKFNIIFCDEAQDFTEIEISLILSLSKYIDYDLSQFPNIPFAFAGDPNQTISPTGFDWSHLKNAFNEAFKEQTGSHIQLSEQKLEYNYRSKGPIVKLANSLQYINNRYFSEDTLEPQKIWNSLSGKIPSFYYVEDNNELLELGFNKCVTITSDDGEYRLKTSTNEFTEDSAPITDSVINDWLSKVENKEKKKNILTSLSAKGQEYPSVLLYKFAESVPEPFVKILNEPNTTIERNTDEWYQCSSFLTKLYIAVSRARSVLYIFDTKEGYNKFWRHFKNNRFVNNLLKNTSEEIRWRDITYKPLCGGIREGEPEDFEAEVKNNFNPLQIAITLKNSSLDSQGFIRAAGYYKEAGYDNEAQECIAWSYFYNNEYGEAGDLFMSLRENKEKELQWRKNAVKSYWKGYCWNKLENCSDNEYQKLIASYMLGRKQFIDIAKDHSDVFSKFRSDDLTYITIANQILDDKFKGLVKKDLPIIIDGLDCLYDRGFDGFIAKKAELFFSFNEWKKAINEWNNAKAIDASFVIPNNEYNIAQEKYAELEDRVNDIIIWKNINGKAREIIKDYGSLSAKEIGLNQKSIAIIFNLLIKDGNFNKALNYRYYKGNDKYQRLYDMDKLKFLVGYVLNDNFEDEGFAVSTSEKYYEWVENKVEREDYSLFDNGLSKDVVFSIFNSSGEVDSLPVWVKFMSLRDNDRYRLFIGDPKSDNKPNNINFITEAILEKIKNEHNKYIDSCFVEIMFDKNWYNYNRVRRDSFLKIDWDNFSMYGNEYFKECGLWVSDLETISKNMRVFIEKFLSQYIDKKTNTDTESEIKTLLKAYTKAVPRNYENPNDESKPLDNWQVVVDFCRNFAYKFSRRSQKFKEFFMYEGVKLGCSYKSVNLSEFSKLFAECQIDNFAKGVDESKHLTFVRKLLTNENASKTIVLNISKLSYLYDLKIYQLEGKEAKRLKKLSSEFIDDILALNELKDESIYNLKLVVYLLESMLDSDKEIETLYLKIANSQVVTKDNDLVDYFKKRSLSERSPRPIIEFGVSNSDFEKIESIVKETEIEDSGISVNPQGGRLKKVEFFDEDEIATVKKGKLDDDFDDTKVVTDSETKFTILGKLHVTIISENEVHIRYKNKRYKVTF